MALSDGQLAAYRRDGFVVAEGLYPPEQMLEWKRIMTGQIAAEPADASGVRVWMADSIHPVLREAMKDLKSILAGRAAFYSKAEFQLDTSAQPLEDTCTRLRHIVREALKLPL